MINIDLIIKEITESIDVKRKIIEDELLLNKLIELSESCVKALNKGGKVIFCGSGGSFADGQHLSAEFTSRYLFDRPALASIALGTNNSGISAMGNDYGYENIFSRELEAIAKPDDVLICITTSGNSPNIVKAVDVAKQMGLKTWGSPPPIFLAGRGGDPRQPAWPASHKQPQPATASQPAPASQHASQPQPARYLTATKQLVHNKFAT